MCDFKLEKNVVLYFFLIVCQEVAAAYCRSLTCDGDVHNFICVASLNPNRSLVNAMQMKTACNHNFAYLFTKGFALLYMDWV
mmetsp:Transcript_55730/g.90251  ORF Transcript_55730/g.90251 Transcript_55730/m.90251 type:complete len:82 (+) Transcript_55730:533-778(+)